MLVSMRGEGKILVRDSLEIGEGQGGTEELIVTRNTGKGGRWTILGKSLRVGVRVIIPFGLF